MPPRPTSFPSSLLQHLLLQRYYFQNPVRGKTKCIKITFLQTQTRTDTHFHTLNQPKTKRTTKILVGFKWDVSLLVLASNTRKKNRRPVKKNLPPEQNHGSYVPLDYDVSIKLDIEENNIKAKPREPSKKSKIKKKVRFNSNVKTYEPIPNDDDTAAYLPEGEDETTKWDFNSETKSRANLHYQENYSNLTAASYRYKNYDDEDDNELEFDGNDISFEEDSENDPDDVFSDDGIPSRENFPSDKVMMNNRILDEKNQSLEGLISKSHGRDRSRYPYSMLSPVENLAQWKIVKAKAEKVQVKSQKENSNPKQEEESFLGRRPNSDSLIPKNMIHSHVSRFSAPTIAVDASFSNWNAREM